jgi:hypothetical protein
MLYWQWSRCKLKQHSLKNYFAINCFTSTMMSRFSAADVANDVDR